MDSESPSLDPFVADLGARGNPDTGITVKLYPSCAATHPPSTRSSIFDARSASGRRCGVGQVGGRDHSDGLLAIVRPAVSEVQPLSVVPLLLTDALGWTRSRPRIFTTRGSACRPACG
jgi:hypothetical protein